MSGKPVIEKLGTIGCDLVETTPVVFRDRLYRFESVRRGQRSKHNPAGDGSFRFIDVATGESTPEFAVGYCLGSAYVAGDMVYAYGVPNSGPEIGVFWSEDVYLTVFREIHNAQPEAQLRLVFLMDTQIDLDDLQTERHWTVDVGSDGTVAFHLPDPGTFLFLRYQAH